MLLSHGEILELIAQGVIENTDAAFVNAASLDVTLADEFLTEQDHRKVVGKRYLVGNTDGPSELLFEYNNVILGVPGKNALSMDRRRFSEMEIPAYSLEPGEFILCATQQVFNLPNYISADYKLKSSMARIGLEHLKAGWCDPGWNGSCLTLELKNLSCFHSITLTSGVRIGQVVFMRNAPVHPDKSYAARGRYNNHKTVEGAR